MVFSQTSANIGKEASPFVLLGHGCLWGYWKSALLCTALWLGRVRYVSVLQLLSLGMREDKIHRNVVWWLVWVPVIHSLLLCDLSRHSKMYVLIFYFSAWYLYGAELIKSCLGKTTLEHPKQPEVSFVLTLAYICL